VVDGVLELGRAQWAAESIDPKRIDAAAVAEDVVEAARGEAWAKSLEIALDVERPAWLVTDASMLRRVLMNLVSNAVKYTDRGTVRMRVRADRHAVRFDVIDTGRGIEPDRVARVFDTYFQEDNPARKPGRGYGLGLTIVNRLVQRLGGTIDLESTPGRGSTFTVVLPTDHFAATPATPEDTP
jgi:signal transduction histidine kinase